MIHYFKLLGISLIVLLVGCTRYEEDTSKRYSSSHEAAIQFYKQNIGTIEYSGREQEVLGWVLKCGDGWSFTNAVVGTLSNPVRPQEVDKGACSLRAFIHTHPRTHGTVDFFSEADMNIGKWRGIYLLSLENYYVRFHNGTQDRDGYLLGKLK